MNTVPLGSKMKGGSHDNNYHEWNRARWQIAAQLEAKF